MARVEIEMPQMGESVMEGTVIEWTKNVGDMVEEDETLLEIATDKVDTEVPSPQAGKLVEIKAEEGETIEVGQVIAVLETDADATDDGGTEEDASEEAGDEQAEAEETDSGQQEEQVQEEQESAEEEEQKQEEETKSESDDTDDSSGGGERIEVQMPKMGESVMEGTVIGWSKSVGDSVEEDETLLEISTDKVDTEVPSPEAGTLVEILVEEGETIEVGQTIAIIETGKPASGSTEKKETQETGGSKQEEEETKKEQKKEQPAKESTEQKETEGTEPQRIGSDGRFYSPLVRSIAKEEGISQEELESIEGSGQGGRVSKQDIMDYLEDREAKQKEAAEKKEKAAAKEEGLSKPAAGKKKAAEKGSAISAGQLNIERPSENVEVVKMDRMRKMIAEHMINSKKTSAHVTTFAEVDVTKLVKWREANKKEFQERSGEKLTYTPLFIEQIIQAIREYPLINSSIDLEKGEIHLKKDINFGLAVALGESGEGGLIVPVIKKAQEKNLVGLAGEVSSLAKKARSKNLSPDDLVGGTITLTNYGSVGNLMGTPIINQPQVAIIGTGAIEKRPVVVEADGQDVIAIRHMMYLSMSYDHRIIDGAHGGAFLNRIKELLEDFDPEKAV
ncbi:MAG: 2-oxoglutarate dehydrogenase, E2 component, dihydrolipoamide succinyltransferase [Balneolaceae bacterium]|nr:2-oxoglutarate dehydrogenase, E2 component, dihydrolipoamide succinyltransferase [Balneolaceae bacterium]